jgi:septal ring factor EnvC (AmiA/AmiB activator)
MRVFICNGCKMQHDAEELYDKIVHICNGCKLQFGNGNSAQIQSCPICEDNNQNYNDAEYHKDCGAKVDGVFHCNAHRPAKEKALQAGTVIQKYAQEFWNELGGSAIEFKQTPGTLNRNFKVQFDVLTLEVKLSAVTKSGDDSRKDIVTTDEIIALNHNVSGIKSYGSKTYEVGIHNHQDALEDVASALVRSLRSKKSALTVERRQAHAYAKRQLEYAALNPFTKNSRRKYKLQLLEIESDRKKTLNSIAARRGKINSLSKFLVGKLAEFKKAREEQKQLNESSLPSSK